jgi:Flp pilus assembly protein TadD
MARALALARFRGKDCRGADAALARVSPATQDPDTLNVLGLTRTCLGRRDEAIALFERSLALRPGQPGVIESLKLLRGEKALPGS